MLFSMSDDEKKKILEERIREILWYVWDPIGVNHVPEAWNEYTGYVAEISSIAWSGATSVEIAKNLSGIEKEKMNFNVSGDTFEHDMDTAELILHWVEFLHNQDDDFIKGIVS